MNLKFKQWLNNQSEEFRLNYLANQTFGDGRMTVEKLRELDTKYNVDNLEGEND